MHLHDDRGCPPASGCRCRRRVTRSPPPGAQAPIHGARAGSSPLPTPVPPKQVQPCPGSARPAPRAGDLLGRDPEQDHVVHHLGALRQHVDAGDERVARQRRVEQEAAVVVGARRLRRRRVRLGAARRRGTARPRAAGPGPPRSRSGCGRGRRARRPRSARGRPRPRGCRSATYRPGRTPSAGHRARRGRQRSREAVWSLPKGRPSGPRGDGLPARAGAVGADGSHSRGAVVTGGAGAGGRTRPPT